MTKAEALRLSVGDRLQVQHANCRPIVPERFVRVKSVRWLPWRGLGVNVAAVPLRSSEVKQTAAKAEWVAVIDEDGKDWGSREVFVPYEELT